MVLVQYETIEDLQQGYLNDEMGEEDYVDTYNALIKEESIRHAAAD